MKRVNKINLLADYVLFPRNSKGRYENIIIHKFVTPTFMLSDFVSLITSHITGFFEIRIAFSMLTQKNNTNESEEPLRYIWAQRCLSINENQKIASTQDHDNLINEIRSLSYNKILNLQFLRTCELCEMQKSGIIPRRLLSVAIHLSKFS